MIPCNKEEELGRIKEYIESTKGMTKGIFTFAGTVTVAILTQIGIFMYLWGGAVATIRFHDEVLKRITRIELMDVRMKNIQDLERNENKLISEEK